jgi:DNA-binding SARP family transcriptional activator
MEVDLDGMPAQLGRRRERSLLAILLLELDKVVSVERLTELLWDGRPPASPRKALHSHVSRLRSVVDPARDGTYGVRLHGGSAGYFAEANPRQVDVHRFVELFSHARVVREPEAKVAGLREALALWRGPALAGTASDLLHRRLFADLDEQRLEAIRLVIDGELECGRHREVIGELTTLTSEHPEREELWAQLALALYRCDRQTEALAALSRAREHLVVELGIDPGQRLRDLHARILHADPTLRPAERPAGTGLSHSLPMDIADFTGRKEELARLDAITRHASAGEVVVCTIEGMAGVGKTRLVIRAAHHLRRAGRFDEIQLWADLSGFHPEQVPLEPADVLSNFLRLLGVPLHEIPPDVDTRAALYRQRLSGRRALVVLDNAADEEQVRPLLPGDPGCLVLVTSRRNLTALDGAHAISLDVFEPADALALLERHAGTQRLHAEPAAARRVAELCGNLPIAVALIARYLRSRPGRGFGDLVARLNTGESPLSATPIASAVRAAFALSYAALPAAAQRVFRLLAHHPGADFAVASVTVFAGVERSAAESILDRLVDEHLVLETADGRLGMHDLVRQYAADRSAELDSPADRHAALVRLTGHCVDLATMATVAVHPTEVRRIVAPQEQHDRGWDTPAAAIAWVEREYSTLLATAYRAAEDEGELPQLALRLLGALYRPLANRGHSSDRIALNRLAIRTAQRIGDRRAEAQAWEDLGTLTAQIELSAEAAACVERALEIWTELEDQVGRQACLAAVGNIHRQRGRHAEALDYLERSVTLGDQTGRIAGTASALNYLGLTHQAIGRFDRAASCLQRSAKLYRDAGNRLGEAIALANLGWAHQRAADPAAAIPFHERSRAMFHDLGDTYNEAEQEWGLGTAYHLLNRLDQAGKQWRSAIGKLRDIHVVDDETAARMLAQEVPDMPDVIRLNT